jgi:hypothetical protein
LVTFDRDVSSRYARSSGISDFNSEADCRMRLKSAALFAVAFLFVGFWLYGDARCQSSLAAPVSLAPPLSVTDQGSPPAATCLGQKDWAGLNLCNKVGSPTVSSPRTTAKGPPSQGTKNVSLPTATDNVSPQTAKPSARSAVTKNSPPTGNAEEAPASAIDHISPTPGIGKLPPSQEPAADPGVSSPRTTAKGSPSPRTKNVSLPATDDVSPQSANAKRSAQSAAAKNSPPRSNAEDAPAPAIDRIAPTPGIGKLSPSQEPATDPGVSSPRTTAKGSPTLGSKSVSLPTEIDDVPPRAANAKRSARSAAAKNLPPRTNAEDAPVSAIDHISPGPGVGKQSPSPEPAVGDDGFIVGNDDGEETGRPLPVRPGPAKQSKVRQKRDIAEGPSAMQSPGDQAEVEKLKPNLTICRGC